MFDFWFLKDFSSSAFVDCPIYKTRTDFNVGIVKVLIDLLRISKFQNFSSYILKHIETIIETWVYFIMLLAVYIKI